MYRNIISFLLFSIILVSCDQSGLTPHEKEIRKYRKEFLQSFLDEERSPLVRHDFKYLNFFKADSSFNVVADYSLLQDELEFNVPTSSGKKKSYRKYARIDFTIQSHDYHLFVYESMALKDNDEYKDYLFLPFTDLTCGEQSYGGGRYLDLLRPDFKDGKVNIDFNKCYNPWCAYSDGYNCPVPPSENDLELHITAGEMNYSGPYKTTGTKQ